MAFSKIYFKSFFVTLILVFFFIFTGCVAKKNSESFHKEKLNIYTTIYPLEYFALQIGKEKVRVTNLTSSGIDPHEVDLSLKQLTELSNADVLFYNGIGLEKNIIRKINKLEKLKGNLKFINTSLNLKNVDTSDPHIWLNPLYAKEQAKVIFEILSQLDKKNKNFYFKNYLSLSKRLDELDQKFLEMVKKAKRNEFVVTWPSFLHLANRYGLKQLYLSSNQGDFSPKKLEHILHHLKAKGIKIVFTESHSSSKTIKVLVKEFNLKAYPLYTIENLPKNEAVKEDYFSLMLKNLKRLEMSLT